MTVLLLARDGHAALTLCTDLEASGFKVLAVNDAQVALERLSSEAVDLVLLEFVPPLARLDSTICAQMDSFQLLRRLRLESNVRVIILSRESDDALKLYFLDSGADDYVEWPCRHRELALRMRAVMRRARNRTSA